MSMGHVKLVAITIQVRKDSILDDDSYLILFRKEKSELMKIYYHADHTKTITVSQKVRVAREYREEN